MWGKYFYLQKEDFLAHLFNALSQFITNMIFLEFDDLHFYMPVFYTVLIIFLSI